MKIHYLELFAATLDQALRILKRSFRQDCAWFVLDGDEVLGGLGLTRPNGEHFLHFTWMVLLEEFGWLVALWRFTWICFSQWFQRLRRGDLRIDTVASNSRNGSAGFSTREEYSSG